MVAILVKVVKLCGTQMGPKWDDWSKYVGYICIYYISLFGRCGCQGAAILYRAGVSMVFLHVLVFQFQILFWRSLPGTISIVFVSRQGPCRELIGDGVSRIVGQFGAALRSRHDPWQYEKNMKASESSTGHVGASSPQSHRSPTQVAGSLVLFQDKR